MSAEATNWVWKHSEAAGSDRLVLLALADFCNEKAECYASYGTLVKKTRLGEKTVYRSLKSLQGMGELQQLKRGDFADSGRSASEWRLPKVQGCQNDKDVKLTPSGCQIDVSTIHNNTNAIGTTPTAPSQPPQLTVLKGPNSLPSLEIKKRSQRKREDVLGKGLTDDEWMASLAAQNPQINIPALFETCLVWCRNKGRVASRRQFMAFVRNEQKNKPMQVAKPMAAAPSQSAWDRELAEIRRAAGE